MRQIAHVDLIEPALLAKDREHVTVHLYLAPDENPAEVLELLRGRLAAAELPCELAAEGVEQEDWETGWKAYYHALTIGRRLAVVPNWENFETDRAVIRLDPAWPSAPAPTRPPPCAWPRWTRLVKGRRARSGHRHRQRNSGHRGPQAGRRSRRRVDIDPMCVRTAGENAALSGVQDRFTVFVGDLSEKRQAAGTTSSPPTSWQTPSCISRRRCRVFFPGGVFIASGIIDTRRDEVLAGLAAAGLTVTDLRQENGWVAVLCKNGGEA